MESPFHFSRAAAKMRPSPIRELFKVTQQPGMISFAGGLPDPAVFPVSAFARCADVLERDGRQVLQYGASEGYGPLRESLLEMMTRFLGRQVAPEELLITSGSQQAVNLIARALLDSGDVVVVEAPTYPGTLHCLRNAGARFLAIPSDGDGMQVDALPELVERAEREVGRRPKLIYTVPDFSNPGGTCLSRERRERLIALSEELGIPVFEDDPYGRLRYSGEALPTLKALASDSPNLVYASSFSKVLAPGVRVAWTVASPELIRAMVLMRQGEDLCTSTVTQALVAEYCQRGLLEEHLGTILDHYARKCAAMQRQLETHVPGVAATWHRPEGGFFFWLRFAAADSREVFDRALRQGVAFVPGGSFYPRDEDQVGAIVKGERHARLCFTFADEELIREGCLRLARALADD